MTTLQTNCEHIDAELRSLCRAVEVLSRQRPFCSEDLRRLAGLYHQAAHLFTFVEGNANYLTVDTSLALKSLLMDNVSLWERLANHVRGLSGDSTGAREWFLHGSARAQADAEERAAMSSVRGVLSRIDHDRAAMLARLGIGGGAAAATAKISHLASPEIRSKLLAAWHRVGESHWDALARAVDKLVARRWQHATALGFRSVAERGFASCGVSKQTVRTFLDDYTDKALRERRVFLSRFADTGALDDGIRSLCLLADRERTDPECHAVVRLDALLNYISGTLNRVFGISLKARRGESAEVECYEVFRGVEHLGTLVLDRVAARGAHTVAVPEVDKVVEVAELPRAHVLCVMESDKTISFDTARQILHATGHALVHLVVRPRLPSSSGLDILPLERLEGLSHWFETLMSDPAFQQTVADSAEQQAGLEAFHRTTIDRARNTRLEQAVVAAIDLDIHEVRGRGVREAFNIRMTAMGGKVGISFERAIRFMTAPLFRDHPGMGFVYPWGTAFGAAQRHPGGKRSPNSYFDPAVSLPPSDPTAEFACVRPQDTERPQLPREPQP